jgi:hypothetical protein
MPVIASVNPAVRLMADEISKARMVRGLDQYVADLAQLARETDAGRPWDRSRQLRVLGMIWAA